jgi:glycosidase
MVYYGDEVGINAPGKGSAGDPYNRAPYPWTDESGDVSTYGPPDDSMLAYYTKLAQIRHELPALQTGAFRTLLTSDKTGVYAFARTGAKPVIVVANKSASAQRATVPVRGLYADGTTVEDKLGEQAQVSGGALRLLVPAASGAIFVAP